MMEYHQGNPMMNVCVEGKTASTSSPPNQTPGDMTYLYTSGKGRQRTSESEDTRQMMSMTAAAMYMCVPMCWMMAFSVHIGEKIFFLCHSYYVELYMYNK